MVTDERGRAATRDWEPGALVGERIDAYCIQSVLGAGGMGEVYHALDTRLGRPVALKIVHPLYARDHDFATRFQREVRAAAAINHPNVAQVYWAGTYQERPYYVMELVEGQSLAKILRAETRLSGQRGLSFLAQACAGLAAAQAMGIIHRDVKPANLMVDAADQVKIVDFGLARRLTDESDLTQGNFVPGTPRYMSPEQARGERVTQFSDQYSLGATFYHLFAGEPPFDAPTPLALMLCHANDPLPPLKERNPRVPAPVCSIVERMMAKRPEDRYPSYDEIIADIGLVREGRGGMVRAVAPASSPASLPAIPQAPAHRRVSGGAVLAAVGFAAGVVIAVLMLGGRGEPMPAAPSAAAPAAGEEAPESGEDAAPASEPARPPGRRRNVFDLAFSAKTMAAMRTLATAVEVHRAREDRFPASMAELMPLLEVPQEDVLDGWKRRMRYQLLDFDRYRISSAGPDGVFGGDDDLVLENGRFVKGEPDFQPFP